MYDGRIISKLAYGTEGQKLGFSGDFLQYVALKHALMSGGMNHIDTAPQFRYHNSERITGQVLRTLCEKYGYFRDQFFISSKQGFTSYDEEKDCPLELEIEELIGKSNGKL